MLDSILLLLVFALLALLIYSGLMRWMERQTYLDALASFQQSYLELLQECIKSSQFLAPVPPPAEEDEDDEFSID